MTRLIRCLKPQGKVAHLVPHGVAPATSPALCGALPKSKYGRSYWVLMKDPEDRTRYADDRIELPKGKTPCYKCKQLRGNS